MIRQNLNYLIIKRLNTIQDLFRIMREYSLGIDKANLQDIYEDAVNEDEFMGWVRAPSSATASRPSGR